MEVASSEFTVTKVRIRGYEGELRLFRVVYVITREDLLYKRYIDVLRKLSPYYKQRLHRE